MIERTATTWYPPDQAADLAGVDPGDLRRDIAAGRIATDAAGRLSDAQVSEVARDRASLLGRLRQAARRHRKAGS